MPWPNDDRDGLRRCRDCGAWKPLGEFHASSRRPSGRGSYCQPCFNVRSKASYAKRVRERHGRDVTSPRVVPAGHKYCPDCQIVKPLVDYPRNRADTTGFASYCTSCHNTRTRKTKQRLYGGSREYHLRRRYGIGQSEFEQLLAAQGGVCGICGAERPEHVDHDHVTGYVRGAVSSVPLASFAKLCSNCTNGGLGHFRDDLGRLDKAISYLTATASQVEVRPGVHLVLSPRRGMHPLHRPAAGRTR